MKVESVCEVERESIKERQVIRRKEIEGTSEVRDRRCLWWWRWEEEEVVVVVVMMRRESIQQTRTDTNIQANFQKCISYSNT